MAGEQIESVDPLGTTVRRASQDDLDVVVELAQELHRLHHEAEPSTYTLELDPREKLASALEDDDRVVLVAVQGGSVVGYTYAREVVLAANDYTHAQRYVEIDEVFVNVQARRQGGAAALLRGAQEWTLARGVNDLRLSVRAHNAGAVTAYRALGFQLKSYRMGLEL